MVRHYNFAADDPHTAAVKSLLETMRERSIETRSQRVAMPDLGDEKRITQGAGNYNAMCAGCHLAPGVAETELSSGLYPDPPNLSKEAVDPQHAFWVIKHGIKASGMPAWGKSMSDEYVWNLAAFLQVLPKLDEGQFKEMVAHSGGHQHGPGGAHDEDKHHASGPHEHDEASKPGGHPEPAASATSAAPETSVVEHRSEAVGSSAHTHRHVDHNQQRHTTEGVKQ